MQPELLLLVATILLFFVDLFASPRFLDKWFSGIACVLLAAVTALSCIPGGETHTLFAGMFVNTPMTTAMKMVLNIGTILVLLQAHEWVNSEACRVRRGEFYELMFFTLFGMYLMISSGHFLIFFIGLETASLPIAALVAFNKQGDKSYESGAKYLFNAVFSSAIFLMGISFIYGISGSLYFDDIATAAATNTPLFVVACGLPMYTKVALQPLQPICRLSQRVLLRLHSSGYSSRPSALLPRYGKAYSTYSLSSPLHWVTSLPYVRKT